MQGFYSLTGEGHYWLVDGYLKQRRYDQSGQHPPQNRTLVHMSWGWSQGEYDGYYIEGTFDPTQRAVLVNGVIGDGGGRRTDIAAYKSRLKTLTWN
mgnify:CR=1 FL=1